MAMAFIELGTDAELFAEDLEGKGYVANLTRLFAHRPAVLRAWEKLNGAIKANMDLRRYELATLAAARRLRSSYCALAHGTVLADECLRPGEELQAIASDHRTAGLDAA